MTLIQRGRGGWVAEAGGLTRAVGIAMVIAALAIAGCSSTEREEGCSTERQGHAVGYCTVGEDGDPGADGWRTVENEYSDHPSLHGPDPGRICRL